MSKADSSLFNCQNNNELEGIIAIHVDDFLSTGNEQFLKYTEKFTVGKEYNTAFHYLGLDLKEHRNYISLDQTHYIIKLKMKI